MMRFTRILLGSVAALALAGTAQAELVAGWDFSQYSGDGSLFLSANLNCRITEVLDNNTIYHECDTLHRLPAIPPGRTLRCSTCNAVLMNHPKGGLDRPIALYLAAAILFIFANAFPFLTLDIQGREEMTTLIGASLADMVVPYGDNSPMHRWKHVFDAGEEEFPVASTSGFRTGSSAA